MSAEREDDERYGEGRQAFWTTPVFDIPPDPPPPPPPSGSEGFSQDFRGRGPCLGRVLLARAIRGCEPLSRG